MYKLLSLSKIILPRKGQYKKIDWVCMALLSLLFSFFMVFGESFYKTASWNMVFGSTTQEIMALCKGVFFFIIFMFCLYVGWHFVTYPVLESSYSLSKYKILRLFEKYPLRFSLVCFFLLYIPYFIAFFPGIMMGDTPDLIAQGFNLPEQTSSYLKLLNPNTTLNQHHPVIHTLFLHYCIVLGHTCFGSWNIGLFIYSFLQACIMISACSFCISELHALGVSRRFCLMLLVYFICAPRIQNYLFLATKDTIYASVLLIFITCFYRVVNSTSARYHRIFVIATASLMLLLRNDNKYLLLLVVVLSAILLKSYRKYCLLCIPIILIGIHLYSVVLLPSLGITPASRREMLSIPFQQTARYLRDIPEDEITVEEYNAISKVLDYDAIKENYDPERSDDVKKTFNENASKDDMKAYFRAWRSMLIKHPGVFIQATMNNTYDYFYPYGRPAGRYTARYSEEAMEYTNSEYPSMSFNFHYNKNTLWLRNIFELYDFLFCVPVLKLFITPAFYTWMLIIFFMVAIRRKILSAICVWLPLVITILICIAGPCNGWYFRYLYPVSVTLPVVILLHTRLLSISHTSECP